MLLQLLVAFLSTLAVFAAVGVFAFVMTKLFRIKSKDTDRTEHYATPDKLEATRTNMFLGFLAAGTVTATTLLWRSREYFLLNIIILSLCYCAAFYLAAILAASWKQREENNPDKPIWREALETIGVGGDPRVANNRRWYCLAIITGFTGLIALANPGGPILMNGARNLPFNLLHGTLRGVERRLELLLARRELQAGSLRRVRRAKLVLVASFCYLLLCDVCLFLYRLQR